MKRFRFILYLMGIFSAINPIPAAAQSAGEVFLDCVWSSGTKDKFRIKPNSWSIWSNNSGSWKTYDCEFPGYSNFGRRIEGSSTSDDTLTCKVVISENEYAYVVSGRSIVEIGRSRESGSDSRLSKSWRVNRQTGKLSYEYLERQEGWGKIGSSPAKAQTDGGSCERTTDPALEPRRAPKL